jgi:glycosyltransferase involved in cell wall biosynthesis
MTVRPDDSGIHLSLVIPAYNERDNLARLVGEVRAAMAALGKPWELVLVNDGSTDDSAAIMRQLLVECPELRVLSFRECWGQTAALEAGLRAARGRFLATLDADLQNDPRDVARLLPLLEAGECDFVNGWRRDRRDPWLRLVSTRIANGVRNWLTHEDIRDSACALKVFRRECLERVKFFKGMHRFLPTLVGMEGWRVKEVPVSHRPRTAGVAKYGVWNRVFRALRDAFAVRWMQSRTVRYEVEEWRRDNA